MRHHTKDKGDRAVGEVIADLLRAGIQVCLPVSEHLPFDLVAVSPSMSQLRRVQVKFAAATKGTIEVTLRRTHADRHGVHNRTIRLEEIDAFAVFRPESNAVYYVMRNEIPSEMRSQFALRLVPARNGQVRKVRAAADYEGAQRLLGPVAQRKEQGASNA